MKKRKNDIQSLITMDDLFLIYKYTSLCLIKKVLCIIEVFIICFTRIRISDRAIAFTL
jgi:hypothetical protein